MAELWQAYGTWVLYGLGFLLFFWLHGFMHGHGGHGGHGGARGGVTQGGAHGAHAAPDGPPIRRIADGSLAGDQAAAAPHRDHGADQKSHKHSGGCC